MNSVYETDESLSEFKMGKRNKVREVLQSCGGGSKTSYHPAGFLADHRSCLVKANQQHDAGSDAARFTLADTSRNGYFVDHKIRQLVQTEIINKQSTSDTAKDLVNSFKQAMQEQL